MEALGDEIVVDTYIIELRKKDDEAELANALKVPAGD
jgi:hypothetical protein